MKSICGIRTVKGAIAFIIALVFVSTAVIVLASFLVGSQLVAILDGSEYDLVFGIVIITIIVGASVALIAYLWISICILQKCLIYCFPVACGHRWCILTGEISCKKDFRQSLLHFPNSCGHRPERSSKNLREILLSVDKAIPTEEQLQEFQEGLRYLNDIKTALEKGMAADAFQFVYSGSVEERYGIPVMMLYESAGWRATVRAMRSIAPLDADLDVMFCSLESQASFSRQGNIHIEPLVTASEGFSGYAQLITAGIERTSISSKLTKQKARDAIRNMPVANLPGGQCCFENTHFPSLIRLNSKGPTMKLRIQQYFEVDITICIKCPEWPPMSDWSSRPRYWPSVAEAQRIMSLGCHLVPKSSPKDKKKTSWRFSFSLAEVELSKLVSETARKCFLALKIILKDHLEPVVPGMIKSYHIKTIFLNTLEKKPVGFWVESNIEECFLTLLAELRDALKFMKCPHHWFSSINLFGRKETSCFFIKKIRLQRLAKKVQTIMKNPAPFLFYDSCCSLWPCCFREPPYNFTPGTSEQFLAEYEEVMLSADRHVISAAQHRVSSGDLQCQPSVSCSIRSEAELDPSFCSLSGNQRQENTTGPKQLEVHVPSINSL